MRRIQGQHPEVAPIAMGVLVWVVYTCRPLQVNQLQEALAVGESKPKLDLNNLSAVEDLTSFCAGLVTIELNSQIVRLVYCTTQEYFERKGQDYSPGTDSQLATVCLPYLTLRSSSKHRNDQERQVLTRKSPFHIHALSYWGLHALFDQNAVLPTPQVPPESNSKGKCRLLPVRLLTSNSAVRRTSAFD